jgi:LAS superfamily LD-carboxypeptidase LdcB
MNLSAFREEGKKQLLVQQLLMKTKGDTIKAIKAPTESEIKKEYDAYVKKNGKDKAKTTVQAAGHDEHQTGLAIDLTSYSADYATTSKFGETDEGKWVYEHAHEYGFILRYPSGKRSETGYYGNFCHLRFVGETLATYLHDNELTLDEYFRMNDKLPEKEEVPSQASEQDEVTMNGDN